MNNELASTLIEVAYAHVHAGRALPDHLIADLQDVARTDSIAHRLRNDASRLLHSTEEVFA